MRTFFFSRRWRQALWPWLLSASALAAPPGWVALDAAELDAARGRFGVTPELQVALGIERLVAINGEVVAQSHLSLLGSTGGLPGAVAPMLVQNGAGNLAPAMMPAMLIQNTLDAQHLDSRTVIHASVNSAALLDTINFQGQLSDALARAAAPR